MNPTGLTLAQLVAAVEAQEQSLGYAKKDTLIAVAEFMATHMKGYHYTKEEGTTAIILLARYRMANLADRLRGLKLIAKERAKAYVARCCNCGAVISSEASLKTGLGSVCRKRLGVKAQKAEAGQ